MGFTTPALSWRLEMGGAPILGRKMGIASATNSPVTAAMRTD